MDTHQNTPEENTQIQEEPQGNTSRIIIAVGVVVLLAILVGLWFLFRGSGTNESVTQPNVEIPEEETSVPDSAGGAVVQQPTTQANGEAVSVSSQSAGDSVLVSSATVSAPSWIAVREEGWILGAGRVDESVENKLVPLLRATEAGKTYEVVMYIDDGDLQFDHLSDALVEGVSASFVAQ